MDSPVRTAAKQRGLENLRPWKKGQSGNPGGRPRKMPLTDALRRMLDDPKVADDLARSLIKRAKKEGRYQEFNAIADRAEGKVPLRLEHSGVEGEAIKVEEKIGVHDLIDSLSEIYGIRRKSKSKKSS